MDIYFTQRETEDDPWEAPQNAGPVVNSSANEICPTLTIDSHHLLFVSDRAGGCGGQDLYVAWRRNKRDDTGWEPAHNLGCAVNSASNDFTPSIFEDPGTGDTVRYFSSNRPGGPGGSDIFTSTLDSSGVFGVPAIVWELSTAFDDQRPYVRKDGLELFFDSNRPGSQGADLWTSTRAATSDPWFAPVNLGTTVNSALVEGRPALSFDGQALYFMSSRAGGSGGLDLYVTTRSKLHESEP